MGVSLKLTTQVTWMVQNHLLLSGAAFRKNPHRLEYVGGVVLSGSEGASNSKANSVYSH